MTGPENPAGGGGDTTPLIINEVQLILAEQRTHLAVLRTGIAVFVLPISVLSFLIVFSQNYNLAKVIHLLAPLLLFCLGLVGLGAYLIWRAVTKLRHAERVIKELKRRHPVLAGLVD